MFRIAVGFVTLGAAASMWGQEPVSEIVITTNKQMFLYDVTEFTVKAGTTLKLTLKVPADSIPQPHNIVFGYPGKEMAIVQAAMGMMADPTAAAKGYVPEIEEVFTASELLNPGEEQVMEIEIPAAAGDYPYVCTFPGHFTIMKGVMKVVE